MAFADLLDYTVRVWRPAAAPGVALEDVREYEPAALLIPGTCHRPRILLADTGPGLADQGERVWYFNPTADVQERDVLETVTGPEVGKRYEVDGPPAFPRGHHQEVPCKPFLGDLPPLGS